MANAYELLLKLGAFPQAGAKKDSGWNGSNSVILSTLRIYALTPIACIYGSRYNFSFSRGCFFSQQILRIKTPAFKNSKMAQIGAHSQAG